MLRSLFALTALLTGLGTDAFAAGTLAEAIPVPGGTVALARAIGLETPPDPSRFVAELVRLTFSRPQIRLDDPATTLTRLTEHLDAAVRFRSALDALPEGAVTLALASREKDGRDQLAAVLELVNLRLKENRGTYSVETGDDREAAARVERLSALGVDLQRLGSRLNAGESVQLTLPTELVPIPLTAAWWSEAVFHRPVTVLDLFAAIFADSGTALLCHGLAALDDETLTYVADHPALLERLTGNEAPAFATFASNLHVRNGRMVTPGEASGPLWESVVEEKIDDPASFILALLSRDNGHLAYLYDLVAELDAPRGAFALGLWLPDDRVRIDRFKSLASTVHSTSAEWQVRDAPFIRPIDDIGWMLLNMTVEQNGAPRGPVATELWSRVFESLELPDEAAARKAFARVEKNGTIDAAWLANVVLVGDAQQRGQRLQQLAFGLRAFSAARRDAFGDVLTAVRALPVYTALMLTLERMGITDPAVHAAAARRAQRLSDLEGSVAFIALSQFQGAMALISRMSAAGSLEPARALALVSSLAAISLKDDRYGSLVVQWLRIELLPAILPRNDAEASVLAALAGKTARTDGGTGRVSWEGEQYRLDLPAAEERRLVGLRRQQRAYSVDTALALEEVARSLAAEAVDLAAIQRAVGMLRALLPALRPSATAARALRPEGVESLPDAAAVVDRVLRDLSKITKPNDAKKATRLAEPLRDLSGAILGEAMSSIAYALDLGGASESALLGVDLSRRHDFGLALKVKAARRREAWAIPRQMVVTGMPRRVSGSLLGLDVAFARSMLRRVVLEDAESSPVILSNDRETFTRSVALLNPYSMRDADRDAITEAVSRGRARIDAVVAGSGQRDTLDIIAGEIKLDGWRRRAAQWDLAHDPRRLPSLFSLTELLVLGAGDGERFDGWGMSGTPVSGCLCTRFAAPNEWRIVGGRPQIGSLSTAVADLNLHVATMLSRLRLPAPLARMILSAAVQEFMDRVRPNDANDWLTLVRGASVVSRERIEDYVAAATADGPLLPEKSYRAAQP